jgi:hypothetical protein
MDADDMPRGECSAPLLVLHRRKHAVGRMNGVIASAILFDLPGAERHYLELQHASGASSIECRLARQLIDAERGSEKQQISSLSSVGVPPQADAAAGQRTATDEIVAYLSLRVSFTTGLAAALAVNPKEAAERRGFESLDTATLRDRVRKVASRAELFARASISSSSGENSGSVLSPSNAASASTVVSKVELPTALLISTVHAWCRVAFAIADITEELTHARRPLQLLTHLAQGRRCLDEYITFLRGHVTRAADTSANSPPSSNPPVSHSYAYCMAQLRHPVTRLLHRWYWALWARSVLVAYDVAWIPFAPPSPAMYPSTLDLVAMAGTEPGMTPRQPLRGSAAVLDSSECATASSPPASRPASPAPATRRSVSSSAAPSPAGAAKKQKVDRKHPPSNAKANGKVINVKPSFVDRVKGFFGSVKALPPVEPDTRRVFDGEGPIRRLSNLSDDSASSTLSGDGQSQRSVNHVALCRAVENEPDVFESAGSSLADHGAHYLQRLTLAILAAANRTNGVTSARLLLLSPSHVNRQPLLWNGVRVSEPPEPSADLIQGAAGWCITFSVPQLSRLAVEARSYSAIACSFAVYLSAPGSAGSGWTLNPLTCWKVESTSGRLKDADTKEPASYSKHMLLALSCGVQEGGAENTEEAQKAYEAALEAVVRPLMRAWCAHWSLVEQDGFLHELRTALGVRLL